MLTTADWDTLFNKHANARRVCVDDFWRAFQAKKHRDEVREIDQIARQRKQDRFNRHDTPKANWRHLGKQSLMDVPTDVPIEKILRDQTGIHHPYGDPWRCSKCGALFNMGFPPDYCPVCRTPSFIANKTVNLRA